MFCPQCGNPAPAEGRWCTRCGTLLEAYPPAGPPSPGQAVPPPAEPAKAALAIASLGDRLLAVILDTVPIAAVFALVGMWASGRWGGVTASGFSLEGTAAWAAIGATLLFGFLYYWLCEGLFGKTLGKAMLGLSVRRKDGRPCTIAASLIRNCLRIIDGLAVYLVGFIVAICSASRQRLGDHAAGTVVVSAPAGVAVRTALVAVWLILSAGGFAGAYLIHRRLPQTAGGAAAGTSTVPSVRTGDLQFVNATFLQAEDGPARPAMPYKPGDTVHLKYEVVGFTVGAEGNIDLLLQAEARDPNGLSLYPLWEKELIQTVPSGRPVNGSFSASLPSFAPSGVYKIDLKARDKVKNAVAEHPVVFQTEAPAIAPAVRLELRDFTMSLSREGPPADPPTLTGGGTVYMNWKVFGMEAKDNRVNLRVALRVTGPGNKTVLDEPRYVEVDQAFHYRPPTFCLPMTGHITLPGSFAKGAYTAGISVLDEIAKTEIRHSARFDLR